MKNKPWKFRASGRGKLTIEIFDQIGEDPWTGEGTSVSSFREELDSAGPDITDIKLLINSGGGEVFTGLAIYDLLLAHPARITAKVIGLAASISSVIPMAASRITMARTALWMIHNPATLAVGDSEELRKTANVLDRVRDSMVLAYQRHMTLSRAEIQNLMQAESWFGAEEAKASGLVAEIDPDESEDDGEQRAAAALRSPIAKFFHPPARVAQIAARSAAPGDGSEQRRRKMRLRTLELHQMELDDMRRETMAQRSIEIASMHAADAAVSEDQRRRRVMAQRDRELRAWRMADCTWQDYYVNGVRTRILVEATDRSGERRRLMAKRELELGRRKPRTFAVRVQL